MKTACDRRSRIRGGVIGLSLGKYAFVGAGVLSFLAGPALAGPEGAQVVRGNARISQQGATTLIEAGHNSIINYSSFNIGANEAVRFVQPGATARVLNRINSAMPTQIDGSLTANGIVYLVNPAGVMFGKDSVINVGGIYAAAGNITDANFLAGIDYFTNLNGSVVNHGSMNAGVAHLIGKHVANHGVVLASDAMTMVAGDEVFIGEWHGRMLVKVQTPSDAAPTGSTAGVENTGTVRAGRVSMAAGDVYSLAINNSGTVAARDIQLNGGRTGEVRVSGRLDASASGAGETGGRVEVLGDRVALRGANIDASGPAGGGTVLVGGDYQGGNDVRTARTTTISSDSVIRADATQQGDGGRVIVWSDQRTGYAGHISARGGRDGGDGGFAEVSGKEDLLFVGTADLGSSAGRGGSLLLDPRDITVATGGGAALADVDAFADGEGTDVTIAPATITAVTNTGTAVTLQASRDITVTDAIITNNPGGDGGDITMQAGRSILINANITTDNGNLTLRANENAAAGVVDADRSAGAGVVTMGNGTTINTGTGDLVIVVEQGAGLTNNTSGDITLRGLVAAGMVVSNNGLTAGSGVVFETAVTGVGVTVVSANDGIDFNANYSTAGAMSLNADADGDGTGSLTLANNVDVSSGSQPMNLTAAGFTFGNNNAEFITSGRMIVNYTGANGIGLGTSNVAGGLNLADSAAGLGHFDAGSYEWVTLNEIRVGALNRAGEDWTFRSTGSTLTFEGGATALGALTAQAAGGITASGQLNVSGLAYFRTLNNGVADITLSSSGNTFGSLRAEARNAAGTADSLGTIDATATGALNIAGLRTAGNAAVTSTGAITDSGAIVVGGAASFKTLNNGGAAITLDEAANSMAVLVAQSRNAADDADASGNITVSTTGAVDLAGLRTTGAASITATGAITDSGDLIVGGAASFTTRNNGGAAITLDNATSSFGSINAQARTADGSTESTGAITISKNGALDIAGLRTGGAATVTTTGAITDSGAIAVGGAAAFKTLDDAGAAITLDTASNVFNGSFSAQARNAADNADAAGTIAVVSTTAMNLASLRTTGDASVTAGGAITDSGALVVGGAASFITRNNGGAAITLDHGSSSFGSITAEARTGDGSTESTGAITLTTPGALAIDSLRTGGAATVTAGGAITQSGAVAVGGAASFKTVDNAGAAITLDHASNAFGSISAQSRNAADNADASGNITVFENSAMTIAGARTTGDASFTATGAITDSAPIVVGGQASFRTRNNTAQSITLGQGSSSFGSISAQTRNAADNADVGGAISVFESGAMNLASVRTTGNAFFTATGAITDSGTLAVGGTLTLKTLDNAGAAITLDEAGSTIAGLSAQVRNLADTADANAAISVFSGSAMNLASLRTLGNATITTTGAITDSGDLTVGGAASFRTLNNAGAAITLDSAGSTFGSVAARSRNAADNADAGGAITIVENGVMDVAAIATTGAAALTAGTVNVNGAVAAGTATINADTLAIAAAITADGGITLQPITAGRTIGLNDAAGAFNLTAAELALLNSTGTVTIGAANSGAISIGSLGAIDLSGQTYSMTLRGGAATFASGITLADNRTMTFQTGAVNGSNPGVDVTIGGTGTVAFNTTGDVDIDTAVARLGASTMTGVLDLNNGSAALEVTGAVQATSVTLAADALTTSAAITATGGAVTLTTDTIEIGAAVNASAGNNITLQPATAGRTIGINDAAGDFNLSAAELAFLNTTGTLTIGRSGGTGAVTIGSLGALDLSAETYSTVIRGGEATFADTLRLGNGTTLTMQTGAVTGSGGLDIRIDGATGGVAFDVTGAVGSSANPIQTQVRNLAATTTSGGVFVENTGALAVATVNGRSGVAAGLNGDVEVVADGPITIDQAVAATGSGAVFVRSTGGDAGNVAVNAAVTTQSGAVTLRADNNVSFAAAGDVTSTSGNVEVTADFDSSNSGGPGTGGAIAMADGAVISTGGTIALSADGNVAVGRLVTSNTTSSAVSVSSGAGDITDAGDTGGADIQITGVGGAATLTATLGRIGSAGNALEMGVADLNATGATGINIANFAPALTAVLNSTSGTVTLNTSGTLTTGGSWSANVFDVLATDITINDPINATGVFAVQRTSAGTIGLGDATGDMTISNAELDLITAASLSVGGASTTGITVDGVTTGIINVPTTLLALSNAGTITFSGGASSFHTLTARANDGISVDVGLSTATGAMTLNGDFDNAADTSDAIVFAPGLTIESAGGMTLASQTGGMRSSGDLTLVAGGGLTISDALDVGGSLAAGAVNGITIAGNVTAGEGSLLDADSNADGAGVFTLNTGATLSAGGQDLIIRASDMTIDGSISNSGGGVVLRRPAGGSIGVGDTAGDMTISGAELQRITASSVTIGGAETAQITVDGIQAAQSANAGRVVLNATDVAGAVQFSGGASSFDRLTVNAGAGVAVNANVSVSGGSMVVNADSDASGAGAMTVANGVTVSTGGNALSVTAADLALDGSLNAGDGAITVVASGDKSIGLGATAAVGGLNITGAELERITAGLLALRSAGTGSIIVDGVTGANSGNISGLVTLDATGNGGAITFTGGTSTFRSLDARADNGIAINADVTTTVGALSLNGDSDNAVDASDAITIGAGRTLTSAGLMTLRATTGGIGAGGALTLVAGDLALESSLDVPGHALTIRRSSAGGIGLGDTEVAGGLNISAAELERITAGSLTLGGDQTTLIRVDNITAENSANISGLVTLLATGASGQVEFINNASVFRSLAASANDGLTVNADLSTNAGSLTLNGDFNDTVETNDRISIGGGVTIASGGALTLNATSGGVLLTGEQGTTVTLRSTDDQALTVGAGINAADNSSLIVTSQGTLSLTGVNLGSGDFSATADANSNTSNVTFTVSNITARDITLAAGNDANDTIVIASDLTAGRHLMISNAGTVTLGGNVNVSAGGMINMAIGVTGISLTGEAGSTNVFTGGAGEIVALAPITATNAVNLTVNSRGDMNLASATVGGGTLTLNVDAQNEGSHTGTFGALTAGVIRANGTGANDSLAFNGPVTATGAGGIAVDAGAILLGANMTASAGKITLQGSTVLAADSTLSTGASGNDIEFLGTVDGSNVLTVQPGTGNAIFAGAVGAGTGLRGLVIPTSGSVRFDGTVNIGDQGMSVASGAITLTNDITAVGDVSFSGPVTLTNDLTITGNDIAFNNILNSDGTARSLRLNSISDGVTSFSGVVGGLSPLRSLSTNADGSTRIAADIFTSGGMFFGDAVVLGGNVVLRDTGATGIAFRSTIDSDAAATPRTLTILTDTSALGTNLPLITFGGNVGSTARLSSLFLNFDEARNVDGRAAPAQVATIVARQLDEQGNPIAINDPAFNQNFGVTITAANVVQMGFNEKFTSLGGLRINAGTQARIGDLGSRLNLVVDSPSIVIRNRPAGGAITSSGFPDSDSGVDFVGRSIAFSVAPTLENAGFPAPTFGTENGIEDVNGTLTAFSFRAFGKINASDMVFQNRVLDLRSAGPTNTNIAPTIAGAIPRESQSGDVSQDTSVGQAQRDQLTQLGIFARDLTLGELLTFLVGRSIYNDYPERLNPDPVAGDYKVAVTRLPAERVQSLLDTYDRLVNGDALDENGRPVVDPDTGLVRREPRTDEIRENLQNAMRDFRRTEEGREFDGAAFRAFLESTPEHAAAMSDIRGMEDLFRQLRLIGLTPQEFTIARDTLLQFVTPRRMQITELEAVIDAGGRVPQN